MTEIERRGITQELQLAAASWDSKDAKSKSVYTVNNVTRITEHKGSLFDLCLCHRKHLHHKSTVSLNLKFTYSGLSESKEMVHSAAFSLYELQTTTIYSMLFFINENPLQFQFLINYR